MVFSVKHTAHASPLSTASSNLDSATSMRVSRQALMVSRIFGYLSA